MKTLSSHSIVLSAALGVSLLLSSCENNKSDLQPQEDLTPQTFHVEIPPSISNKEVSSIENGRIALRAKSDTAQGNEIYENLNTFIAVGEFAAKGVEDLLGGVRQFKLDRVKSFTFVSEDDNRTKSVIIESEVSFEGRTWDYALTLFDVDTQGQADGGKGLQIFWNKTHAIEGIAIVKLYNCDRVKHADAQDAIFRIDYSETGNSGYDAIMEVQVALIPVPSPLEDSFAISSLHMFAGRKGDVVDVFGNSNHPNAIFLTGNPGLDWAFVASGSDSKNIGVAEVGLPASNLDSDDRTVLLKDNSIRNVLKNQINTVWPGLDQSEVDAYLMNTAAPGYFDEKTGFIAGGESPGAEWDALAARLEALSPYNPAAVSNLTISFK